MAKETSEAGSALPAPAAESTSGFPPLAELVGQRAIRPGMEWAYVRGGSMAKFRRDGWSLCPYAKTFEAGGVEWVVMMRGEPIRSPAAFVPQLYHEVVGG